MTWVEQGYVNIKKGFCTWRIRDRGVDKNNQRYKKTIHTFTTPLIWCHIEHYECSLFGYSLFLVFDIDGRFTYDTHIQIDEIKQSKRPQWLPSYPKHIENFDNRAVGK